MKLILQLVAIAAIAITLSACGSARSPISTAKISEHASNIGTRVAVADTSVRSAAKRTDRQIERTRKASQDAKTTSEHIEAAMKLLEVKDYIGAAQHLLSAKVGNETVMLFLNQTLEDLSDTKTDLSNALMQLGETKEELAKLKLEVKEVQKKADAAADDAAIAKRCKSFFGLGAIFYGVERLVKTGIIGIIIIILAVIILGVLGKVLGRPVAAIFSGGVRGASGLWGRWRQRKQPIPPQAPPPIPFPTASTSIPPPSESAPKPSNQST